MARRPTTFPARRQTAEIRGLGAGGVVGILLGTQTVCFPSLGGPAKVGFTARALVGQLR